MSTRKPSPRNRALRPTAEDLETRQMLSGLVTGTDAAGNQFTLRLLGPGALTVTKQPDATGVAGALTSATDIDTITVGGTDPLKSRLYGTMTRAAGTDGRIFFQHLVEMKNGSESISIGLGLLAINMPNFWLGTTAPTTATTATAPSISIPDGVATLRFGGVDTTHNQAAATSTSASTNDAITLGQVAYGGGDRIIIDKSISSVQTVAATTPTGRPTTIQHGVSFVVSGRLSLFQANEIDGDPTKPPGQFGNEVPAATGTGGTLVVSGTPGIQPFFVDPQTQGSTTGQIGDFRIGGNATNLTTLVLDSTGSGNAKLTNFSIGGETNNILVVVPNGIKNAAFGLGLDTTEIITHVIDTLSANRGALNSKVNVDRTISRLTFGGDVVNTTVRTGVEENYPSIISTISGQSTSAFSAASPAPPPDPINSQIGGGMTVLVAGSVIDSVFAASTEPGANQTFGTPNDLKLPTGHIAAKVEGKIDNTNATPDSPTTAFYAKTVNLKTGPVVPPVNPLAPYPGPSLPIHSPGIPNLNVALHGTTAKTTTTKASTGHFKTLSINHGATTPIGPAASSHPKTSSRK